MVKTESELMDYEQAKVRRETALAELAELELAKKRNEVIPTDEVFRIIDICATACREHLQGIPGRYATIFAAEDDPAKIEHELSEEIRTALFHVSNAAESFCRK